MTPAQLRAWRQKRGWSQARLAVAVGRAENSIIAYERDGARVPVAVALACEALDYRDAIAKIDPAGGAYDLSEAAIELRALHDSWTARA